MIVLHLSWATGNLYLWGETPDGFATELPYGEPQRISISLPAVRRKPVPSSGLIGEPPAGKPKLAEFEVCAAVVDPVEFLIQAQGKQVLEPGVVLGDDIAFWTASLRFAGGLVARQQYLPDLDGWRPIFLGADAERLHALAAAMPQVSRAISPRPAQAILREFASVIVGRLVRNTPPQRSIESVHDRWLAALESGEKVKEPGDLAVQVRAWQRPLLAVADAPFRLAFRLEEPGQDDAPWHVRYLAQDKKDLSLFVPVEKISKRDLVLMMLGQAASIAPRIETSLRSSSAPLGYEMDLAGAHEFLSIESLALEQAGFGVLLPAWWTRRGTKARLTAKAKATRKGFEGGAGLSMDSLVKFEWQIALGGEPLTLAELKQLAALKVPLVKIRGQWVQMTAQDIQAALDYWKKKPKGETALRDLVRMSLGAAEAPGGLEIEGIESEGEVAALLDRLQGKAAFEELPPPAGLHATLRPYQVRGYSWLAFLRGIGFGACLADDMGLGKTIQTLSLIQHERNGYGPVLLVCPMSVIGNWQKEAERFTPDLPVMVHHGSGRVKGESFRKHAGEHAMVISSYSLLARDAELLKTVDWSGVVLDEAQNIKNPETRHAAAARAIAAGYRIALTGTPVENNVGDLWSIMEFLNPGLLGSRVEFKRKFFLPIQSGSSADAAQRLKRITAPFILRRLKTDRAIIGDLPDKLEMKVFCTLTREQASLYAAVVKDAEEALKESEGIQRKGIVLATLSKLKQVCNHPAQFLGDNSAIPGRSGKLARLTEMLEEAFAEGDRALVFTQFAEMGEIVRRHLQETFGREVPFLHGGVPKKQRDALVERFQNGEGSGAFVLSLKAGGTGLNLTRANHVFHFDRWWNPAVENQATDRAFRIGQKKNVQVHKFLCAGTLEEKIDEMIERKKEIAEGVVGTGEGWLTELSNDELREIMTLRKEAFSGVA